MLFWGLSFVATKAALREVTPVTLIFSRFALGTAALFFILGIRREPIMPPRDAWPMLMAMGFVGVFVHHMLQAHALVLTSAVHTGWLIGLTPIWAAVLAAAFLGERFGPRKVLGLVLGALGAILVITRGEISSRSLALPTTRGDLMILASTVNWAVFTVMSRNTLRRVGSRRAIAVSELIGWVMLAPFFVKESGWREYHALSSTAVIAIGFLGVACSGLGYLFWYAALERIDASQVAAFLYLEPLVTFSAAVVLLGESVAWTTIVGGLLVLVGVLAVQTAGRVRPRQT